VLSGGRCYCVPSSPPPSQSSTTCSTGCVGSSCPLLVYKRTITAVPVPLPAFPEPRGLSFTGCFRANAWLAAAIPLGVAGGVAECSSRLAPRRLSYCALVGNNCYGSSIGITGSFKAGLGQCSTPCESNPLESCGSSPQSLPARRGSIVARQEEDPPFFATLYGPQDAAPATTPPTPGTAVDISGWSNAGCYDSELYLLDSLLTGFSYSVAADPTAILDGDTCITSCVKQDPSYLYAATLGTTCYCTTAPPPANSLAADQTSCNLPCQGAPTERCGGKIGGDATNSVFATVFSKVAAVRSLSLLLCSMLNAP
jgi:hypothetical protein